MLTRFMNFGRLLGGSFHDDRKLGSLPFGSHGFLAIWVRGPRTPGLEDNNDHHGCAQLVRSSWDDPPSSAPKIDVYLVIQSDLFGMVK